MKTRKRLIIAPIACVRRPATFVLLMAVLLCPPEALAQNNPARAGKPVVSARLGMLLNRQAQRQATLLAPLANAANVSSGLNMSASLPRNYLPAAGDQCSETLGTNVKVNQNCLNISSAYPGFGQEADETAIAQDPNHPNHLVAASNNLLHGNYGQETYYSLDGGQHWRDSTPPIAWTDGTAFGAPSAIEAWQAFADPSVAWDTNGNVYSAGVAYQLDSFSTTGPAGSTNNSDLSSAIYLFRSTLNNGASWSYPATPVFEFNNVAGTAFVVEDKPYMTVDSHVGSPFRDRIYVTWDEVHLTATGAEYVWESYSDDYGETFSPRVLVSGNNTTLCPVTQGLETPQGNCNLSYYPQPFTGPDGALYVVFGNINNPVSPTPSNCAPDGASPCDNRYQILLAKSTDGGVTFGLPVKVADFFDLPDCATYQGAGQAGTNNVCVPEKGASTNSVFDIINFPVGAVNPNHPRTVVVTVPSYINVHSKESNGCVPAGFSATTGRNFFTGVKTPGACNNDILVSVSNDGGLTFTGGRTDVRSLPSVTQGADVSDQFRQWVAFTRSGEFVVAYYDRRYGNDETTGSMDISLSGSNDGIHFRTTRVTSSSMPLPTQYPDAQGNGLFFGDYMGLSAVDDVHVIWTDTRDPDLFLCPGTGQPGVPPAVCTMTGANGIMNNMAIFTRALDPP